VPTGPYIPALPEQPEVVRARTEATSVGPGWAGYGARMGIRSGQWHRLSWGMIGRLEGWQTAASMSVCWCKASVRSTAVWMVADNLDLGGPPTRRSSSAAGSAATPTAASGHDRPPRQQHRGRQRRLQALADQAGPQRRPCDAHRDRPYPSSLGCNTACPTWTNCRSTELLVDIILFQVRGPRVVAVVCGHRVRAAGSGAGQPGSQQAPLCAVHLGGKHASPRPRVARPAMTPTHRLPSCRS
jgi:hypothetical protein